MSFKTDNENFIRIKLFSDMKELSDEDRLIKYESVKEETRKRLKKSYTNSLETGKVRIFYEEVLECLAFYETDYLLLNLFFEKDVDNLFTILSYNNLIHLNFKNKESFSYNFWEFMDISSSVNRVDDFLKTEFIQLIQIDSIKWEAEDANRNDVTKGYASWLMKSNKNSLNKYLNIFSYIIFCKIWNHYDLYNDYLNIKAIVFYNAINKKFDNLLAKGFYVDLNQIVIDLKEIKDVLFVENLTYYPLLDDAKNLNRGYVKQRKKFNTRIELSKELCKSYVHKSYDSIFYAMIGKESVICKKIHDELNEKLNKLEIPNSNELNMIKSIKDNKAANFVKQDFLRRLYIY